MLLPADSSGVKKAFDWPGTLFKIQCIFIPPVLIIVGKMVSVFGRLWIYLL
jgi:hypothetical protein